MTSQVLVTMQVLLMSRVLVTSQVLVKPYQLATTATIPPCRGDELERGGRYKHNRASFTYRTLYSISICAKESNCSHRAPLANLFSDKI